ncbi:MAG: hypothetical protein ABIR67_00375 [Gaiellaceae bacterium]
MASGESSSDGSTRAGSTSIVTVRDGSAPNPDATSTTRSIPT